MDNFAKVFISNISIFIVLVVPFSEWENDMPGDKNVDLAAISDIESSSSLSILHVFGSNLQTKCIG